MKLIIALLLFTCMTFTEINAQANRDKKVLIAYYSRRGSNYQDGEIVNLQSGNTEVVAHKIKKITGSDLFYIETVKAYPADYYETTRVAKEELNAKARPAIKGKVEKMADYDVIYLGYPNWWGTMPMAVFTFLESYDLTGKTIIPFCTHEGSRMGRSEQDIRRTCPRATVLNGLSIRGSSVQKADAAIQAWIKKEAGSRLK